MILSGAAIEKLIKSKTLEVDPQPIIKEASVKIHLSDQFGATRESLKSKFSHLLSPKSFIIGKSKESITLPNNIAALYDGYIGMAAQGIFTHASSMFIDPKFNGQITLEIYNASDKPIELTPDMRIGHIIFVQIANLV